MIIGIINPKTDGNVVFANLGSVKVMTKCLEHKQMDIQNMIGNINMRCFNCPKYINVNVFTLKMGVKHQLFFKFRLIFLKHGDI